MCRTGEREVCGSRNTALSGRPGSGPGRRPKVKTHRLDIEAKRLNFSARILPQIEMGRSEPASCRASCPVPHQHRGHTTWDPVAPSAGRLGRGTRWGSPITVSLLLLDASACNSMRDEMHSSQQGREKGLARLGGAIHPAGPTKSTQGCCKRSKFHAPPALSRQGLPHLQTKRRAAIGRPLARRSLATLIFTAIRQNPSTRTHPGGEGQKPGRKSLRSTCWSFASRMPGRLQVSREPQLLHFPAAHAYCTDHCSFRSALCALPAWEPPTWCLPLPAVFLPAVHYHRSQP